MKTLETSIHRSKTNPKHQERRMDGRTERERSTEEEKKKKANSTVKEGNERKKRGEVWEERGDSTGDGGRILERTV